MTKRTFQQAAQPKPVALFKFNEAVADFYAAHPDAQDKIFFIDPASGNVAHPDPAVTQELVDFITRSDPGKEHMQPIIADCAKHKTSYCKPNGPGGGFVFVYSGADALRLTNRHSHAVELQFIFDHETAHALIEDGRSDNRFLAESVADAYATVRHLQRTGGDTGFIKDMMLSRAAHTLFTKNGILNFSCPVIDKILDDAGSVPFEKFSHAETVSYVTAMARQHTPDGAALRSLHDNVAVLKDRPQLSELQKVIATTTDANALVWGQKVMQALATARVPKPGSLRSTFTKARLRPPPRPTRSATAAQRMSA